MSLPAAQQRVLDGMAEALRDSEPRMAAMFAIFTRLSGSEVAPGREQLAPRTVRDGLADLIWYSADAVRRCWFRWRRPALLLVQLAVGVALAGLLISMGGHGGGCATSYRSVGAITRIAPGAKCRVQAGSVRGQLVPQRPGTEA